MIRIPYDNLVLGKEYKIKKDNVLYRGVYYCHYRQRFDDEDPITFMYVTPNPENKKYVEFKMSDEFYI